MATQIYEISGMTCRGCVKRVQAMLAPFAQSVVVSLQPSQVVLQNATVELPEMAAALAGSHYSIKAQHSGANVMQFLNHIPKQAAQVASSTAAEEQTVLSWFATYKPLLMILAYLLAVSVLAQTPQNGLAGVNWHETMRYFMAGFFLVFSFFKLLDLNAFADAYASYDILAKRWHRWGLIYPFVELALGIAYLSNWNPLITNWMTLIVMGFSAIGVIQAVMGKQSIRCACLGTVFKLPMSTVTIIEDLSMVTMAALGLLTLH